MLYYLHHWVVNIYRLWMLGFWYWILLGSMMHSHSSWCFFNYITNVYITVALRVELLLWNVYGPAIKYCRSPNINYSCLFTKMRAKIRISLLSDMSLFVNKVATVSWVEIILWYITINSIYSLTKLISHGKLIQNIQNPWYLLFYIIIIVIIHFFLVNEWLNSLLGEHFRHIFLT